MVRVNHNSNPICNPNPTALFGQVIQLFGSTDEKLVFMSVKFAKILKFLVYYRLESVQTYFKYHDVYSRMVGVWVAYGKK